MTDKIQAPQALLSAQRLANSLDNCFCIPVLNLRFGWDSVVGLIPGLGDVAMLLLSGSIVFKAGQLGVPLSVQMQMLKNILIDFVIGLLPVIGDVADVFYRANQKNVRILERWWVSQHYQAIQASSQQALASWQKQQNK